MKAIVKILRIGRTSSPTTKAERFPLTKQRSDTKPPFRRKGPVIAVCQILRDVSRRRHALMTGIMMLLFLGLMGRNALANDLVDAARKGDFGAVRSLLAHGANVNQADSFGNTPLQEAGYFGHPAVVKLLLKHGAREGLIEAAAIGDLATASTLLAHGANVNQSNKGGLTPLEAAAYSDHTAIVKLLLAHGANVTKGTPLLYAADGGHVAIVKLLLAHGANVNESDTFGKTPLFEAAMWGKIEVAKLLLAHGANVNQTERLGETPLYRAVDENKDYIEVVKVLLAHGANVNQADKNGDSPLQDAVSNGQDDIVKILLNHGAIPTQKILDESKGEIKTLIQEAMNVSNSNDSQTKNSPCQANNSTNSGCSGASSPSSQTTGSFSQVSPAVSSGELLKIEQLLEAQNKEIKSLKSKKKNPPAKPSVSVYHSSVDRPSFRSREKRHMYALVIGVEHYPGGLPDAQFADRDAQAVYRYLIALGVPPDHIRRLTDGTATRGRIRMDLRWLKRNAKPDSTVWVYFSGHGAPGAHGHAYLVPSGGDPNGLAYTAFREDRLYRDLDRLPAKRVLVALDACFSGNGGRSVLGKGMRPLTLVRKETIPSTGKLIVFSAARADQEAGPKESAGHGLFTYYFLKGLDKGAVRHGHVTVGSLSRYLKVKVPEAASLDNHDQVPQVEPHPVGEIAKVEIR